MPAHTPTLLRYGLLCYMPYTGALINSTWSFYRPYATVENMTVQPQFISLAEAKPVSQECYEWSEPTSQSAVRRFGLRHSPRKQHVYLEAWSGVVSGRFHCVATVERLLTGHSHSLICVQTARQTSRVRGQEAASSAWQLQHTPVTEGGMTYTHCNTLLVEWLSCKKTAVQKIICRGKHRRGWR